MEFIGNHSVMYNFYCSYYVVVYNTGLIYKSVLNKVNAAEITIILNMQKL